MLTDNTPEIKAKTDNMTRYWLETSYCEDCDPPYGVIIDLFGNGVPDPVGTKRCHKCAGWDKDSLRKKGINVN